MTSDQQTSPSAHCQGPRAKDHPSPSTLRILTGSLLAILLAAIISTTGSAFIGLHTHFNTTALPIPALGAFLAILAVVALVRLASKVRLFLKSELVAVLYAALIAAPIATVAFWQIYLPFIAVIPRSGDFGKLDVLPSSFWPHGPELLDRTLSLNTSGLQSSGSVSWQDGPEAFALSNASPSQTSSIRVPLPLAQNGPPGLEPDTAYQLSILLKVEELQPGALYFARLYYDGADRYAQELFSSNNETVATLAQPEGFAAIGRYNFQIPPSVQNSLTLEVGLQGQGAVLLKQPSLFSVQAMEDLYQGRRAVDLADDDTVYPSHLLRDANRLHPKSIVPGHVPWADWKGPILSWGGFLLLSMIGLFSLQAIMRRKWMETERLSLPFGRVTSWIIGCDAETAEPLSTPTWKLPVFRIAFAAAFVWCLLVGWSMRSAALPELVINIPLKPFLSSPELGESMQAVAFTVSLLLVALALFIEINLLFSIVVGYFLFRFQYWFGESIGLETARPYPYPAAQFVSAYLGYAVLMVCLSGKYLVGVFKQGLTGANPHREAIHPSLALGLLAVCLLGAWAWSSYTGVSLYATFVCLGLLLSFGFVASKLRAEAGLPQSQIGLYWIPQNLPAILPLLGVGTAFGASGMLFFVLLFAMVSTHSFIAMQGIQMEAIEMGSRHKLKGQTILLVCFAGVGGGFLIGGWTLLNLVYGQGIDQLAPIKDFLWSWIREFRIYEAAATDAFAPAPFEWTAEHGFAVYGASASIGTGLLRHFFAGFWFHPVGILLGPTQAAKYAWGSLLLAGVIRFAVMKIGGAVTVREKLLPAALGIFLAAVTAHLLFWGIDLIAYLADPDSIVHEDLDPAIPRLF